MKNDIEKYSGDIFILSKRRKGKMAYAPKKKIKTIREVSPARRRLTLTFLQESPVKLSYSSNITMRNDDTAKKHERLLKSIGRILDTVPKSYPCPSTLVDKEFSR